MNPKTLGKGKDDEHTEACEDRLQDLYAVI